MRKHATKITLFLLLGALVNLIIAWVLDWYTNTTTQTMSLVSLDRAKSRGWISRVPDDAIAAWGWEGGGSSYVAAVAFDEGLAHEVDAAANLILFPFSFTSLDTMMNESQVPQSALVVESRVGWPMRAFGGRVETERSPQMVQGGKGRIVLTASLNAISGRPPKFDMHSMPRSIEVRSEPLNLDRLSHSHRPARVDPSGFAVEPGATVPEQESNDHGATPIRPERRRHSDTTEQPRAATRIVDRDESADKSASDDTIEVTGHFGIGLSEVRPLPAAANGRWNTRSIIQNFDPDYRVSPLPYRPTWPGFAVNTLLYGAIAWLILVGPFALRRFARSRRGLCVRCAYDLRGADHERCPECGTQTASRLA